MVVEFLENFVGVPMSELSGDGLLLAYALAVVMAVGISAVIMYGLIIILRGWK